MSKEIATLEEASNALAAYDDYEEQAGSGMEEATADAFAVPFLAILQSGSPQCKRSDGAYIDGAQEGFLLDTVAQEALDPAEGVLVVPVYFRQTFVEWKPDRGGFVAEHPVSTPLRNQTERDEKNHDVLPNGNELVDTRKHYVLIIDPTTGIGRPIIVAMTSTQAKKSKRWMTALENIKLPSKKVPGTYFTPPTHATVFKVTTVPESNDKGSWYGWDIKPAGPQLNAGVKLQAEQFKDALLAGDVQEATNSQVDEAGTTVEHEEEF